jgi:NAD-dependent histone deacetylase SIR2
MRCKLHFKGESREGTDETGCSIFKTFDGVCDGPVKPNIVFFGESLPKEFHEAWQKIRNYKLYEVTLFDKPKPISEDGGCDLMIIVGTALAVTPFSCTVDQPHNDDCPRVLINLTNPKESGYDFEDILDHPERLFLQGKCDDVINKIVEEVGWS